MRPFRIIGVILVGLSLSAALSFPSKAVFAQSSTATLTNEVKTADFDTEVQTFLEKELGAHLGAIAFVLRYAGSGALPPAVLAASARIATLSATTASARTFLIILLDLQH